MYAFCDPDDNTSGSPWFRLLNDGPCPRLAVGVPVLASKVASNASKAAMLDQLYPCEAQLDSSELAAAVKSKARRKEMKHEVDRRLLLQLGAAGGSTSSSSSVVAPFTTEESEWIDDNPVQIMNFEKLRTIDEVYEWAKVSIIGLYSGLIF